MTTGITGRINATTTEGEAVGKAGTGDGPRRPVTTALASAVELLIAWTDIPAPHKE